MTEQITQHYPKEYTNIQEATDVSGFKMASDILTCSLLRTLAASKPSGRFLELGTGTGLSTAWILDGMNQDCTLTSIDNEPAFLSIAEQFLGHDLRLKLVLADGGEWIAQNKQHKFDYIFADTWPGKYLVLDEVLAMLNKGGFYIIDDLLPQPNWPAGHHKKVINLVHYLENRADLLLTKQDWATGMIIAVKK